MPQVALFVQGLAVGFAGSAVGVAVASAIGGAAATGAVIGGFLAGPLGSLLLTVAVNALMSGSNRQPKISDSRVNIRIEDADRWIAGGTCAVGGSAGPFMEFDAAGNFWYIVAHLDGELTGSPTYLLDGVQVVLSAGGGGFTAGDVITDDFCVTTKGQIYPGTGTKVSIWRIYTVTPDASNVYGALPAAFTTAFPDLPANFRGAGVVFSIIRGKAQLPQNRANSYRWRGPIGTGEPAVTLIANFNRMYDPRNGAHNIADPDTWTASNGNAVIVWAWFRTDPRGKGQPMASVDWAAVITQANLADTTVQDRNGDPVPRYRCGLAFPDSKERGLCEREILATMDAFVAYSAAGLAYPVVGYYTAPTVILTGDRDLMAIEESAIDNGSVPLDGVICEYIEPDLSYARVESAPWVNAARYVGVAEPEYDRITVLGCQSHTQAVLLAKAHGQRTQGLRRGAIEVGLRGVKMIGQRAVDLEIDAIFDGPHEIVAPIDESLSGMIFRTVVVPLASDRWTLGVGEEGEPPQVAPSLNIDNSLETVVNAVLTSERVVTSSGLAIRMKITFNAPIRIDRAFRFRFAPTNSYPQVWEFFETYMDELRAVSRIVDFQTAYAVEVQTITAGGRATEWTPLATITAARYFADYTVPPLYQIDGADVSQGGVLSLTRATTATFVDGNQTIATAGINAVRRDYTGGASALMVEAAATNLVLRSQEFDHALWVQSGLPVTANTATAPDGTTTADRLVPSSANATHTINADALSFVSGTAYTASVFAKADGYNFVRVGWTTTAFADNGRSATFNLATGVVDGVQTGVTASIVALANGWYRCIMSAVADATVSAVAAALGVNNATSPGGTALSYIGNTTSGVLTWGGQTETGSKATSYIPTTTATVTRAADVAVMQGLTATLNLTVTYGDGTDLVVANAAVTPSYWPTLTDTRIARMVGRAL